MKKIDSKSLILSPYISTSWKHVLSLSMEGSDVIIELSSGKKISIPNLSEETIDEIFTAHASFMEQEEEPTQSSKKPFEEMSFGIPLQGGGGVGLDNIPMAMQHNPEAKDMPDLPPEIIKKITSVAKVLGIDDPSQLPKPEPHCNCMHCQIAKALHISSGAVEENFDEEVSDEELTFRSWDIEQKSDKLYVVINPLDEKELYNVYLGDPIGCTCGEKNCEHIKAVLSS